MMIWGVLNSDLKLNRNVVESSPALQPLTIKAGGLACLFARRDLPPLEERRMGTPGYRKKKLSPGI